MNKFFGFILGLSLLASPCVSLAEFPNDTAGTALLNRANVTSPLEGLGTVVHRSKSMMQVVYDFSVLGGALGTVSVLDDQGNAAILPKGAIVTNANFVTVTTGSSVPDGTGTIAWGLLAAGDLYAATNIASFTTLSGSYKAARAGTPVGTAATYLAHVTATAGSQVFVSITSVAFTAGKINGFIEYYIE